jgi:SAM-dependent methyltransferase
MATAYREDLAFIHDAGYGHFSRNAAQVVLEALRSAGADSGLVVDLGCGSGILAEQLVAAGYDVLGIDLSPDLIDLARRRVPGGRFRVASLWAAELPACVGVTAIGECVNYLFDPGDVETRLASLFRRIADVLPPGGVFVFDAAGPGRVTGPGPVKAFAEAEAAEWAVLVATEEDPDRGILTRRITSFRRVGELYRRDQEVHRLRLYPQAMLEDELHRAGFHVHVVHAYGALPLPQGMAAFLARMPGPTRTADSPNE